jgi:hypothetical protein
VKPEFLFFVMRELVPRIPLRKYIARLIGMAGSSPAMTIAERI